ncbi:hypothetical protein GmHk_19G054567 [Glycine max]|nr:hypothetical protein GmHk_19G054567 [Glycine max]
MVTTNKRLSFSVTDEISATNQTYEVVTSLLGKPTTLDVGEEIYDAQSKERFPDQVLVLNQIWCCLSQIWCWV